MSKSGFTLVELMVAIGIFIIISTAVVVNLRQANPAREVSLQVSNLASLLRQAQVQSKAGEPFNGQIPIGGYGLSISECSSPPCSVTLFADIDGNWIVDAGETVETISFGKNVTILTISTGATLNISFKPPQPFICFDGDCSGIGEVTVVLGNNRSNKTGEIKINQISGQISY